MTRDRFYQNSSSLVSHGILAPAAIRWAASRPLGAWNDKYRDTVREYWRGDNVPTDFAARLLGSGDLYDLRGRRPWASVNFITAHDGFTLNDLVSYNEKHNADNGEENNDGHNDNRAYNYGEEGPTENPDIIATRERQKRNFSSPRCCSPTVHRCCWPGMSLAGRKREQQRLLRDSGSHGSTGKGCQKTTSRCASLPGT